MKYTLLIIFCQIDDFCKLYEKDIDKSNSNTTTITVGSIYGGIIFTFGKDDKADTIFIGAAAE